MLKSLIKPFFPWMNLLFILVSISGRLSGNAVIIINNDYPVTPGFGIYGIDEPVLRKEFLVTSLYTGKPDTISIETSYARAIEIFVLKNKENYLELYIKEGDTIQLNYSVSAGVWELAGGNALTYNKPVQKINEVCYNFLGEAFMRPGGPLPAKQINYFTDTLRKSFRDTIDPFVKDYLLYKTVLVELKANSRSRTEIIKRYFRRTPLADNPAWAEAFNELFAGHMRQQLNKKNGDSLKSILTKGSSVFEIINFLGRDTLVNQPELLKLLIIKGIYELGQGKEFDRTKLIGFLKELNSEKEFLSVRKSAETIVKIWERFAKGKSVDFLYVAGTGKRFKDLYGRPVYLCYYPVFNQDTQQELLMLKGLNNKFKKEIHFLAIINVASEEGLNAVLSHLQPGFDVIASSSVTDQRSYDSFRDLLESENSRNYILIDKNGKIWQAPAEGPETGVEAAFLQLIKAN